MRFFLWRLFILAPIWTANFLLSRIGIALITRLSENTYFEIIPIVRSQVSTNWGHPVIGLRGTQGCSESQSADSGGSHHILTTSSRRDGCADGEPSTVFGARFFSSQYATAAKKT